ncbi:MAG: HAD family hydrolase [Nitriliruptoraceae bacterium]
MPTTPDGRHLPDLPPGVEPGGRFDQWAGSAPRLAVFDVDGTLLGRTAEPTRAVIEAFARARDAGMRTGFATGRIRHAIGVLSDRLSPTGPNIVSNGAAVVDLDGADATWPLSADQVDRLLDLVRHRDDAYAEICAVDDYLVSSWDERAAGHWDMVGQHPVGTLDRAADLGDRVVLKVTLVTFDRHEEALASLSQAVVDAGMRAGTSSSPRTPDLGYLNVTHPDADKGQAVAHAIDRVGIDPSATMVVGDEDNDLPMFAHAGTAVAMGQADDAVRRAAHLVVPDVDHDGAAVALDLAVDWLRAEGQESRRTV